MILGTSHHRPRKAFTLLEVILAMSITAIISAVIFSVTSTSMSLSQSIVASQAESRHQAAFNTYLTQLFSNLPTEARITLEENEQQSTTLTIEYPNTEFPAMGRQHIAKSLTLNGATNRDGLTSLNLMMSNQLEDESHTVEPINFETNLVKSLSKVRWEFFDTNRNEWSPEWTPSMGRPSQLKFYYSYPGQAEEYMRYFWIPNRRPPAANR